MRMNWLKYMCILLSVVYLISAITGTHSIHMMPSGTTIGELTVYGRIYALMAAAVLAFFAYGLQRRSLITWKFGFVMLILNYIYLIVGSIIDMDRVAHVKDFPTFWLPIISVAVIGTAVAVVCGLWWKRQRSYFQ